MNSIAVNDIIRSPIEQTGAFKSISTQGSPSMGTETWRPWKHLRVFETINSRPRWFSESALPKEVKTLIYAKVLSKRMLLEHWASLLRPSRKEKGDSEIHLPIPAEPTPPAHSANEYCICIVCPSMSTKIWMIDLLSAIVQGLAQSTKLRRWMRTELVDIAQKLLSLEFDYILDMYKIGRRPGIL